jgi:predicted XRE-type DNA-binding protein
MPAKKRYSSVIQQTNLTSETEAFAKKVERRISQRQIVKHLMALRATKSLSQSDIAKKMECSQSRISKLESGLDDDLRLGEFSAYVSALGLEMRIVLAPKGQTSLDAVKYHAFSIKRTLDRLAALSSGDKSMTAGALKIMAESFYNITRFISGSAQTLMAAENERAPISMEVQEESELPDGSPTCGSAS